MSLEGITSSAVARTAVTGARTPVGLLLDEPRYWAGLRFGVLASADGATSVPLQVLGDADRIVPVGVRSDVAQAAAKHLAGHPDGPGAFAVVRRTRDEQRYVMPLVSDGQTRIADALGREVLPSDALQTTAHDGFLLTDIVTRNAQFEVSSPDEFMRRVDDALGALPDESIDSLLASAEASLARTTGLTPAEAAMRLSALAQPIVPVAGAGIANTTAFVRRDELAALVERAVADRLAAERVAARPADPIQLTVIQGAEPVAQPVVTETVATTESLSARAPVEPDLHRAADARALAPNDGRVFDASVQPYPGLGGFVTGATEDWHYGVDWRDTHGFTRAAVDDAAELELRAVRAARTTGRSFAIVNVRGELVLAPITGGSPRPDARLPRIAGLSLGSRLRALITPTDISRMAAPVHEWTVQLRETLQEADDLVGVKHAKLGRPRTFPDRPDIGDYLRWHVPSQQVSPMARSADPGGLLAKHPNRHGGGIGLPLLGTPVSGVHAAADGAALVEMTGSARWLIVELDGAQRQAQWVATKLREVFSEEEQALTAAREEIAALAQRRGRRAARRMDEVQARASESERRLGLLAARVRELEEIQPQLQARARELAAGEPLVVDPTWLQLTPAEQLQDVPLAVIGDSPVTANMTTSASWPEPLRALGNDLDAARAVARAVGRPERPVAIVQALDGSLHLARVDGVVATDIQERLIALDRAPTARHGYNDPVRQPSFFLRSLSAGEDAATDFDPPPELSRMMADAVRRGAALAGSAS